MISDIKFGFTRGLPTSKKNDCEVIGTICETLKADNDYLSNLIDEEQNLAQSQNRALEGLENELSPGVGKSESPGSRGFSGLRLGFGIHF